MNVQNEHIAKQMADAQQAVALLIEQGMTVTKVSIENKYPRIDLLNPPKKYDPSQMRVWWRKRSPRVGGAGHELEVAASFSGCEIHWVERN
jgi:hypothetical protein